MALMFQRLARNFIKNGYFPTDSETITRILTTLVPATVARCASSTPVLARARPWPNAGNIWSPSVCRPLVLSTTRNAPGMPKALLDRCIHGDFQDCIVSKRSFGLLFLNPPYGDLVSDKAQTGARPK